ncbi:uncharacterized protein V6R79_023387 [Siganus canaliculatus]
MNFNNSNFRSMTSYESHAGKRSHVFEASRPLHLFDQQLGCSVSVYISYFINISSFIYRKTRIKECVHNSHLLTRVLWLYFYQTTEMFDIRMVRCSSEGVETKPPPPPPPQITPRPRFEPASLQLNLLLSGLINKPEKKKKKKKKKEKKKASSYSEQLVTLSGCVFEMIFMHI